MSVHVSISPDKPTLSFDGTYWFLRIAPDCLIVMTAPQMDALAVMIWSRTDEPHNQEAVA